MARMTWVGLRPAAADEFESVLRQFAMTLCPPRGQGRLADDGLYDVVIDVAPGRSSVACGRRLREHQAYVVRITGTLTLRVRDAAELHAALEKHYDVQTEILKTFEYCA
jgi:hypothetical protein